MNTNLPLAFQPCQDTRDVVLLNKNRGFYLKPAAVVHVRVQWLAEAGGSVASNDLMELIKSRIQPDRFISLKENDSTHHLFLHCKVFNSSPDSITFEAELESCSQIKTVLQRLDRQTFKLNGSPQIFRFKAVQVETNYPSRHDWDSFFQEAPDMNELKAGERPDTVHIKGLPCVWFSASIPTLNEKSIKPSESILREVFQTFGALSAVDIPMLDPFRSKINANLNNVPEFKQEGFFEVYVQFQDYGSFVKCMSAFRGMKLLYTNGQTVWTVPIEVDFDRTKHLSERSIQERKRARERLLQEEIDRERAEKRRREAEQKAIDTQVQKGNKEEEEKIAIEERKLVLAQRKVESLRMLDYLLEKVKIAVDNKNQRTQEEDKSCLKEQQLYSQLARKYKQIEEKRLEQQKDRLRSTVDSCHVKLHHMASLRVREPDPAVKRGHNVPTRRPHRHMSDLDELWHGPDIRNHGFRKPYSRHDRNSGRFHPF